MDNNNNNNNNNNNFLATRIFKKYSDTQQIRLIFDGYDVLSSLKSATRSKIRDPKPIPYHITDSTHVSKVPLKKLLYHSKTKAELTDFLSQNVMDRGEATLKQIVVAWRQTAGQHTRTWDIYRATMKKRTLRLSSML